MSSQRFISFCICLMLFSCAALTACGSESPAAQDKGRAGADEDDDNGDDEDDDDDGDDDEPADTGRKDTGTGKGDAGGSRGTIDSGTKDAGASDGDTIRKVDAASDSRDASSDAKDSADSSSGDPEPKVVSGCDGAKLYEVDEEDTGVLGPWPVGVKTVKVPYEGDYLTAELWYPAKRGSEAGKSKATYDLRDWLPMGASMIPDEQNRLAECQCYRDLPLDTDHGPYPAVVFVHGLSSFRVASFTAMYLWASRGFIVIAADHQGTMLTDMLATLGFLECSSASPVPSADMTPQAQAEIAALEARSGDLAFLGESIDTTRLGLGGHSMGGMTVAGMAGTPNVKVVVTLAPLNGGTLSAPVDSMLQVTGKADEVVGYGTDAYTSGTSPIKRFIGIDGAKHIDVTNLCKEKNDQGQTSIQVASNNAVCGLGSLIVEWLGECAMDSPVVTDQSPLIVDYATTAALEETLHCQDRSAAFAALESKFSLVSEYLHTP